MNTNLLKSLAVVAVVASAAVSTRATIINLTVDPSLPPGTTAYVLGAVNPGVPADDADKAIYLNGILGLALGGSGTIDGNSIYRSLNTFSGLPAAGTVTAAGAVDGPGTQTMITLTAGFNFLVAKYDGPNGGTEVWYIGGLAVGTVIDIPANAFGDGNNQYGLSGTALMDGTTPPPVPDGGSTVVLLGLSGLGLFAFVRRTKTA